MTFTFFQLKTCLEQKIKRRNLGALRLSEVVKLLYFYQTYYVKDFARLKFATIFSKINYLNHLSLSLKQSLSQFWLADQPLHFRGSRSILGPRQGPNCYLDLDCLVRSCPIPEGDCFFAELHEPGNLCRGCGGPSASTRK